MPNEILISSTGPTSQANYGPAACSTRHTVFSFPPQTSARLCGYSDGIHPRSPWDSSCVVRVHICALLLDACRRSFMEVRTSCPFRFCFSLSDSRLRSLFGPLFIPSTTPIVLIPSLGFPASIGHPSQLGSLPFRVWDLANDSQGLWRS